MCISRELTSFLTPTMPYSVQSLSHVLPFVTPWTTAYQASLFITNSWSLLKLLSFESVMPSNHLILCHPLLLLPSIFPSIRVFSNESALHIRWPKYWSFNISPSNKYSGLISFRMDWLDLLAVQEAFRAPQFKSINSSALGFLYSPTLSSILDYWKNHSSTRWTFVGKVMSLLFNMLSRLVIAFFPQGASTFNFMAAVTIWSDFGAQENKVFHWFPLITHLLAMKWYSPRPWC